jgi:hypothetical protein
MLYCPTLFQGLNTYSTYIFLLVCQFNIFNATLLTIFNSYCILHQSYFKEYKICESCWKKYLKTAEVPFLVHLLSYNT